MQDAQVVTGKYLGTGKVKEVGQNGYTVRSFWIDITTNPEYPNTPEFQLKGDKVNLVNDLKPGQTIVVKYNLDGRKYDKTADGGKKGVVTNLNAWRIEVVQTQSAAAVAGLPQTPVPNRTAGLPQPAPAGMGNAADDDIPF